MLPPNYTQPQPIVPNKKPTSVFSWLGFGLSLGTLLIIVTACILTIVSDNDGGILMITFLGCFWIGILGLIFSIIGLIMAIRNCTPKWMSVSGIISCCLCLFVPIIIALFASAMEPDKKAQPDQEIEKYSLSDRYYRNYD